jgi:hypothetical protein
VKSLGIASLLIASIFLGIEAYYIFKYKINPTATTLFLHFNYQYRAGNVTISDNIIEEPYYKILKMFEKHPSWHFTVEFQARMIERIVEVAEYDPFYDEILNLTRKLNHRGQMEIICGLYSSQLIHPYPQEVIEWDFKHAYKILKDANLTRSRVFLGQEGQVDMGLAHVLDENWSSGIDTLLISMPQIGTFAPPGHEYPDSPVYNITDIVPNKSMYFITFDFLPKFEAGFTHSWIYIFDAELAVEQEDAVIEFDVDDEELAFWENQWLMLENKGNRFFTLHEWVTHCINFGAVKNLDFYLPENMWTPLRYNSSSRWMNENEGSTDDGEMIANNRRGYFTIKATKIFYERYKNLISPINRSIIENLTESAEKLLLLSMVTDTTGVNPKGFERRYGEDNVYNAMVNCTDIISIIISEVSGLNFNDIFQIDLLTGDIENDSLNFRYPTYNGTLSLDDIPLSIDLYPNLSSYSPNISVKNYSFEDNDYIALEVNFNGTGDWSIDEPNFISLTLNLNASDIFYSPSLTDSINLTIDISRNNYETDPVYIYLPLSNGLFYLSNKSNPDSGLAIINNCSSRHTSLLWEKSFLRYHESGGIHLDAIYKIIILEDTNLKNDVSFAQRINNNPLWIISDNITQMAGYSPYQLYGQMLNADK